MAEKYAIVGAGPAGVAAAYALAKHGLDVIVYESLPRPGLKPCGRGIPAVSDLPLPIPKDSIVREVKGAVLYVDGAQVFDMEGDFRGVIVDKTRLLESLLAEAGAEVVYGAFYKPGKKIVRAGGRHYRVNSGLFAGGHGFYRGETIAAVQYRMKSKLFEDLNKLLIYFDTGFIGYYYIFPNDSDEADVGVGGFLPHAELLRLLARFVETNEYTQGARILRTEGARIAVGGVKLGDIDGLARIGEAAGYVLPLTGEGIRPSMISGYEAGVAFAKGIDPTKALKGIPITKGVQLQRRILERVKKMSKEKRTALLSSMSSRTHALVALGRVTSRAELLKLIARDNPKILLSLV